MRKIGYQKWLVGAMVLLAVACGDNKRSAEKGSIGISTEQNLPGDSTVYGLACDGCNDTILVFLALLGEDPDTFNILEASRNHQVFGRPTVGDKMAVVMNPEDVKVADKVINLQNLKGEWCYMVTPTLRERAGMNKDSLRRIKPDADSVLRKILAPREFGMEFKSDYSCRPIGLSRDLTDENSPALFPPLKRYREWRIFNGRLLLTKASRGEAEGEEKSTPDTADFVMMHRDTLVLRFGDGEQGYYRRNSPI